MSEFSSNENAIRGGPGVLIKRGFGGTTIRASNQSRRSSSSTGSYPSQVYIGTSANKVKVRPFVINGLTPTIGGTPIDSTTPPQLTCSSANEFVAAEIVIDLTTGIIDTPTIVSVNSLTPSIVGTTRTTYIHIASLGFSGGSDITSIQNYRFWNLLFSTWGNEDLIWLA